MRGGGEHLQGGGGERGAGRRRLATGSPDPGGGTANLAGGAADPATWSGGGCKRSSGTVCLGAGDRLGFITNAYSYTGSGRCAPNGPAKDGRPVHSSKPSAAGRPLASQHAAGQGLARGKQAARASGPALLRRPVIRRAGRRFGKQASRPVPAL